MLDSRITVIKRDGSSEPFQHEKVHQVLFWCVQNIKGVSVSDIELKLSELLGGADTIKSTELHKMVIRAIVSLISLDRPNYQLVASRAALFMLRKDVLGQYEPIHLKDLMVKNTELGYYDPLLLQEYSEEEINQINDYIDHNRDYAFSYAGLQQVIDKYLVRNRTTKQVFETPQYMYALIPMALFRLEEDKAKRLDYIKRYYDQISTFKLNIPTPIMAGARTTTRQYSSCVLIDIGDSMASINATREATSLYIARKAGIGFNWRVRAMGDSIRNGEVEHTGIVPFIQTNERIVRETMQNGIRGGSATNHLPFWHPEVESYIVLKNNKGTEENRARKLDYSIQLSRIFYERAIKGQKITLISPHVAPELAESFGLPEFDELYKKAEQRRGIKKVKIDAMELFLNIVQEHIETGRLYIMNLDHANTHSSFLDKIFMSNLCQEITLPTTPIQHINDEEGEIALCILSALNWGEIHSEAEMAEACEMAVRGLDSVIDAQEYPVRAAAISTISRRSLGVGITNLACFLAKNKVKYSSPEAVRLVHTKMEQMQYYLLKASNKIAKEKGACEWFHRTKYSKGILPIDTYKKDYDEVCPNALFMDWEGLRADILKYGLRNSTLSAQMPCESSSVASNSTNGIEPVRSLISVKRSKQGSLVQIVPEYSKYGKYYELAFDMPDNKGYINIVATLIKFMDQSSSTNKYYDYTRYENEELPISEVAGDILYGYKVGIKNWYYLNTYDGNDQSEGAEACAGGGCAV